MRTLPSPLPSSSSPRELPGLPTASTTARTHRCEGLRSNSPPGLGPVPPEAERTQPSRHDRCRSHPYRPKLGPDPRRDACRHLPLVSRFAEVGNGLKPGCSRRPGFVLCARTPRILFLIQKAAVRSSLRGSLNRCAAEMPARATRLQGRAWVIASAAASELSSGSTTATGGEPSAGHRTSPSSAGATIPDCVSCLSLRAESSGVVGDDVMGGNECEPEPHGCCCIDESQRDGEPEDQDAGAELGSEAMAGHGGGRCR